MSEQAQDVIIQAPFDAEAGEWVAFRLDGHRARWYVKRINEAGMGWGWSPNPEDAIRFGSRKEARRAVRFVDDGCVTKERV